MQKITGKLVDFHNCFYFIHERSEMPAQESLAAQCPESKR